MPTSIKQIVMQVRDYLAYPSYAQIPNQSVLLRLHHKIDYYRTHLNLTDQNWLLKSTRFTIDANTESITLNASDYGRPVLCYTVDDANPDHIQREIPVTTLQNQDEHYVGTKTSLGTSIDPHVATSFTIYKDAGTGAVTVRVVPRHSISAEYELWFAPDRPTPPLLANNYPLLEHFINLTVVDAAIDLLPNLVIAGTKDSPGNISQINMRRSVLEGNKANYFALFELAKQQSFLESKSTRHGFGYDECEVYY